MLDQVRIPRLVVAGAQGGSGKTSIALGLVAALRARGKTVQTFKVGPDFIDCAYLAHASGRPCRNLDSWMLGAEGVRRSLVQGSSGADVAVIEGVMGLFDSHGGRDALDGANLSRAFPGSTAEVAHLVGAPVILVLDIAAMGETAAGVALGLRHLDPDLDLAGIILDNVPSGQRRRLVEDAIWEQARLPVLGALPHMEAVQIPELRSGLLPLTQNPHVDQAIAALGAAVARDCDLDLLDRVMSRAEPLPPPFHRRHHAALPVRVGVAFDDAFCFYYAENLEILEDAGAEVVTFSPLEDRVLPRDLGALYLGGGLSEAYVPRLSGNHSFIDSVRRAHAQGLPIYAESGAMAYVARSVRCSDSSVHDMTGLIPVDVALEAGSWHTGYRDLSLSADCVLGPRGLQLRGHECHFSRLLSGADALTPAYAMHDCDGEPLGCEGWTSGNLLASFVHLHFGQRPEMVDRFLDAARRRHEERRLQAAGAQ
jgi:cobyrinic acid a,c-diamide synthase